MVFFININKCEIEIVTTSDPAIARQPAADELGQLIPLSADMLLTSIPCHISCLRCVALAHATGGRCII
jgi:hypothetical protein